MPTLVIFVACGRGGWRRAAGNALAVTLIAAAGMAAGDGVTGTMEVAVKAALLFNFAKFAEWPSLAPGAPIAACVVGDDAIATALAGTVRGQQVSGHPLDVRRSQDSAMWRACQLLFVAGAEIRWSEDGVGGVRALPVLTVSDAPGFSQRGGIIELYLEGGRVRFAINVDAAERSGLRLSSRLLGLAKVVRDGQIQ